MQFIKHYIPSILAIIFLATPSFAQDSILGKVTEYGIYKTVAIRDNIATPETAVGHSTIGDFEIIKTTEQIPLTMGLAFGFKWVAYGFPDVQEIELIHILEHPPLTKPDGTVANLSKETYIYRPVNGKIKHTEGYKFTEEFELVEGLYKFSVHYGDKEIVTKTFEVSKTFTP